MRRGPKPSGRERTVKFFVAVPISTMIRLDDDAKAQGLSTPQFVRDILHEHYAAEEREKRK